MKHATRFRDRIEDEIATGLLKPGERLDEMSLAERFGVSRTPIREALQQLAAGGMVELRPNRSAIVSAPDPTRLMEMFDVMAELEAMCGRLAARRLLPEDEALMTSTLAACRVAMEAGDPDAYYYENERFHGAIYAASGNRFLCDQALALHKRLAPFRRLQLRVRNRLKTSQREHEEILAAILEGNPLAAAERLRAHIAIQGERFGDLVASMEKATM
ncbi:MULTISPECIES: GntR family transcriptional regulator [Rhodomicrobium]|uniref:GntR family transcriptional regulator n=1 Tax=Rhodomicrobium TaxID=1068 RepID=UPI000B4B5A76|nr:MULTISPECIES: GntR family transcriptional regulator [Rhodomicrobium]